MDKKGVTGGCEPGREKFCVLHEFGNKTQLGFWGHREPFSGFTWGTEGRALGTFTIFSLKLVFIAF